MWQVFHGQRIIVLCRHWQDAMTYLEYHLVNLHERYHFTRALISSGAERHLNSTLHFDFLLITAFQEALGAEYFHVLSEYVLS